MTARRGRPPAAEVEGDTRERIIATATELFAANGFHGTGVAEIGARAGIHRGALYYHIKSKEELLSEILNNYVRVMLADAERIAAEDLGPREKLGALLRSHVTLIIRYRAAVAIQLRDIGALTGDRAEQLQALRDDVQHIWQKILDDGHAAGIFRTADHALTNSLLGMANQVAVWYRADGPHTPGEIADLLANTLFDGLIRNERR